MSSKRTMSRGYRDIADLVTRLCSEKTQRPFTAHSQCKETFGEEKALLITKFSSQQGLS